MVVIALHSVDDDLAVINGDNTLDEALHQILGVGNHQQGGAEIVDLLQQLHDLQSTGRV